MKYAVMSPDPMAPSNRPVLLPIDDLEFEPGHAHKRPRFGACQEGCPAKYP